MMLIDSLSLLVRFLYRNFIPVFLSPAAATCVVAVVMSKLFPAFSFSAPTLIPEGAAALGDERER